MDLDNVVMSVDLCHFVIMTEDSLSLSFSLFF